MGSVLDHVILIYLQRKILQKRNAEGASSQIKRYYLDLRGGEQSGLVEIKEIEKK